MFALPKPRNDDWGAKAGNWLREKLLPSVFGDDKRKGSGFHSFRHKAIGDLRDAGAQPDTSRRLVGHGVADQHGEYGAYSVVAAKETVLKIRLPAMATRIPMRA